MSLKEELNLKKGFTSLEHEALLNIYHTTGMIKKKATEFFKNYGLTDVQFNVLELLSYQGEDKGGLTQIELSKMMLVNKSNITSLIDRMEKGDLVKREGVPGDRRYNIIKLKDYGKKKLKEVEEKYINEVIFAVGKLEREDLIKMIDMCEKIRNNIRAKKY